MAQVATPTSPAANETRPAVLVSLAPKGTTDDTNPQAVQALLYEAMEQLGIDSKAIIDNTAKLLTDTKTLTEALAKKMATADPKLVQCLLMTVSFLLTVVSPTSTEVKKKEDKKAEEKKAKDKKDPKDTDTSSQDTKNVKGKDKGDVTEMAFNSASVHLIKS